LEHQPEQTPGGTKAHDIALHFVLFTEAAKFIKLLFVFVFFLVRKSDIIT